MNGFTDDDLAALAEYALTRRPLPAHLHERLHLLDPIDYGLTRRLGAALDAALQRRGIHLPISDRDNTN